MGLGEQVIVGMVCGLLIAGSIPNSLLPGSLSHWNFLSPFGLQYLAI